MARLKLKPETRKRRPKGESLKLGRIRKFDSWSLNAFLKRLDFYGLPYGARVSAVWVMNDQEKVELRLSTRIGCKDITDRRRPIHVGSSYIVPKLPKGRYVSEKWLLGLIYDSLLSDIEHELRECMHVDGHTVFDPHTRLGRRRLETA